MRRKACLCASAALAAAMALASLAAPAAAAMTKDQIKAEVEKTYGVVVLRMTEDEVAGKPALLVTVMNKGGNDNRAFQVNTLVIDPESGHLVSIYRPLPDGYQFSQILESEPNKQPSLPRPGSLRWPLLLAGEGIGIGS